MRTTVLGRVLPLVLALVVAQFLAPVQASAVSGSDYDTFDAVTVNDVTTTGAEVPLTGAARELVSASFDTSTFTLQDAEVASNGGLHGCVTPAGAVYAGRTGWVRFNPGTDGRIDVVAETPGFDAVLLVHSTPEATWGTAALADAGASVACADRVVGPGGETVTDVAVTGDRVYFVQVGGRCAGGPTTCQDAATPGGTTLVRVRFTPQDSDGDGVADLQDNCEGQGVPGQVTSDGCPDADADGIKDTDDSCPAAAGVPAPAPYNGCPDGQGPPDPSSNPYLRIESRRTHDPYSTPSRKVDLILNWPKGATSVEIRNARGKSRVRNLTKVVPWRLPQTRRPTVREVRVRFSGPRIPDLGVGDTIVFDPTGPKVEASIVLPSAQGWYVGLNLADRGTGVSSVRLLDADKRPIEDAEEVCDLDECEDEVDLALSSSSREPVYIEVVDPSGNRTVEPLDRSSAGSRCPGAEPIPYKTSYTTVACVVLRQPCGTLKPLLIWKISEVVRCRLVHGDSFRVVPR